MDGALMRVCIVSEGCYPYSSGGVSSWIHSMIQAFPNLEFVLVNIVSNREQRGKFKYELPGHVTEVYEVYLQDSDWSPRRGSSRLKLKEEEWRALRSLMLNENVEWDALFDIFQKRRFSLDRLLMGEDFLRIAVEVYQRRYSQIMFSDFLWTLRSMYIPLFLVMGSEIPEADVYHCVATGYAGIIGGMAAHFYGSRLLLSEHGIYTREREEDIIRSRWVSGEFKEIWIEFFKKLSFIAYQKAGVVTTLFETNRSLQVELNCPPEKITVIPNGVAAREYAVCRRENRKGPVTLGAVLRVVPIKDVKTMLLAFDIVKQAEPEARLRIMGNCRENPAYYQECLDLLEELGTRDVEFLGQVDIKEHLPEIDLLLLSSISEGQPLAMLEGMAAEIPFVTTNVGNCKALLEGEREDDRFGPAGLAVPVMNSEAMAQAILRCIRDPDLRRRMGQAGRKRVEAYYSREGMLDAFHQLYERLGGASHGGNRI